jgi:WD40 repeat protein
MPAEADGTAGTIVDPNPYVGPRAFEHGETIYGRSKEIAQLYDRVLPGRILLMYAPSGAGKTSLIQAGLVPRLRAADFTVRPVIKVGKPVGDPAREDCNRYLLSTFASLNPGPSGAQQGELAGTSLREYLDGLRASDDELEFLIFDQFEELLFDPTDRPAKEAFLAQVGEALRDRQRWALFAMREDRIAGLDPYLRLLPTRLATRYRLDLLTRQAALEAVRRPAQERGVTFTEEAAEELVDNLARVQVQTPQGPAPSSGDYVEPVLLQVVCERLWDQRDRAVDTIGVSAVRSIGGVDRALGEYYDQKIAEVVEETGVREQALRDWFSDELITRQGFRGQVPHGPDVGGGADGEAIAQRLVPYLVRSEPQRGTNWWELTHDRLIEPVRARNNAWREINRNLLERQAILWQNNERADGFLVRGKLLLEVERQRDLKAGKLTMVERDFLDACRQFADREERTTRRRSRWLAELAIALAVAVVLAAGFAVFASHQRDLAADQSRVAANQQRIATARLLLFQADALRGSQPIDALRLGLAALDVSDNPQTRAALVATLVANRYLGILDTHRDTVAAVAFGADGHTALTGSLDRTAILWDLTDPARPAQRATLTGHTDAVTAVAFAPDRHTALTGSLDGTAILWDLTDPARPAQRSRLTGQSGVTTVAYGHDGRSALTGNLDGTAVLWDVTDPARPIRRGTLPGGHTGAVTAVAFAPDGRTVLTGSVDKTAMLWDVVDPARPAQRATLPGHSGSVSGVAFGPGGRLAFTGSDDGTAILWDVADPVRPARRATLTGHTDAVTTVAFAPDGRTVLTGSVDKTAILWDVADPVRPNRRATLTGHTDAVTAVAFAPDGQTVLTGGRDHRAILWAATGSMGARQQATLTGFGNGATVVVFTPDGRTALTAGVDTTAVLWELTNRTRPVRLATLVGHDGAVTAAAFRPDGHVALVGGDDGTATLWDVDDPARPVPRATLTGHSGAVSAVAFSPDGRTLLSGSRDGTAILFDDTDPARPRQLSALAKPDDQVPAIVSAVAFSPDGRTTLTGSFDNTAKLWDVHDPLRPALQATLTGHTGAVSAVAFSPDGRTALTGSFDNTAKLWDVHDPLRPALQATLTGHTGAVSAVAFSPDRRTALTGSRDGTAILWDLTDPNRPSRLLTLGGHTGSVTAVAVSPDGHTVLTAGDDRTAVVWDVSQTLDLLTRPRDYACAIAGRGLDSQEWHQYITGLPYRDTCPR